MIAYSTFDVMRIFNIPRERLKDWMNQGFIKPTISADGKGTKAEFYFTDIFKIAVFIELLNLGLYRKIAAQLIEDHSEEMLIDGQGVFFFKVGKHSSHISINLNVINEYLNRILK